MDNAPGPRRSLTVSAVVLNGDDGRVITVRKRGTDRFMLPGGKPEPGETALDCAVREVAEELGFDLDGRELAVLGEFTTMAANEPGFALHSTVFAAAAPGEPDPRAEIDEVRWVDPAGFADLDESDCAPWAPLLTRVMGLRSGRSASR